MFGGYYGTPANSRSYIPQGTMTFAAGDTIATNSFVGEQPLDSAEETTEKRLINHNNGEELEVDSTPIAKPKRKLPPTKKEDDDEEDSDDGSWSFLGKNKGYPSYMAFFPIMIGGSSSGKGRSDDGVYPGSATAIANSFSTGKGGVATSHATSFGDPSLSALFKNGFNRKAPRPVED